MKACNGYSVSEVEQQAAAMFHLLQGGFTAACYALPLVSPAEGRRFVTVHADLPAPTLVLSFVPGEAADKVCLFYVTFDFFHTATAN